LVKLANIQLSLVLFLEANRYDQRIPLFTWWNSILQFVGTRCILVYNTSNNVRMRLSLKLIVLESCDKLFMQGNPSVARSVTCVHPFDANPQRRIRKARSIRTSTAMLCFRSDWPLYMR
uniref:Secreted protein n=1 Tax=Angiostrongylus cantonensis TaxID=6313 RepID=A0A0K0D1K3_ANGCA